MNLLAAQQVDVAAVLFWGCMLMLIALGGFVVMIVVKKRIMREESSGGFTWSHKQLLEMRDSGEITIQQYEKLRKQWFREVGAEPDSNRQKESVHTSSSSGEAVASEPKSDDNA